MHVLVALLGLVNARILPDIFDELIQVLALWLVDVLLLRFDYLFLPIFAMAIVAIASLLLLHIDLTVFAIFEFSLVDCGVRDRFGLHHSGHIFMVLIDILGQHVLGSLLVQLLFDNCELFLFLDLTFLAMGVHSELHQVVVFLAEEFLFCFLLELLLLIIDFLNLSENVLALIRVYQAKLFEVTKTCCIVVDGFKDHSEVRNREIDPRELAARDKLLEGQHAIEVDVKVAECPPIVLELFFDSQMHLSEHLLNVLLLLV